MKQEHFERCVAMSDDLRHYRHILNVLGDLDVYMSSRRFDTVRLTCEDQEMLQGVVIEKIQDIEKQIQEL